MFTLTRANAASVPDHYQFVLEYIRELGAIERIRAQAATEMGSKSSNQLADCVRSSTRFQLELNSQIHMLGRFSLAAPFNDLPSYIIQLYSDKLAIFEKFGSVCSTMLAGPKPNIDYGAMAADAPKLNAQLEFIDRTLLDATVFIFSALIDPKPDAQNNMSRLIITKAETDNLVQSIERDFGKNPPEPQNFTVSAASILKTYLTEKGYTPK